MNGLMMNQQLTISAIVEHAERVNGSGEIVSVTAENPRHRYTYREAFARARQLADAMSGWSLAQGDRIATLAWNDYRHFETYYAPACSGYVCHTINPRLFPEQLIFIINHAEDRYVFVDPDFVKLVEGLADQCPTVRGWIVLASEEHMPETSLANAICYETLVGSASTTFQWPALDENAACAQCYTCAARCPFENSPGGLIMLMREAAIKPILPRHPFRAGNIVTAANHEVRARRDCDQRRNRRPKGEPPDQGLPHPPLQADRPRRQGPRAGPPHRHRYRLHRLTRRIAGSPIRV